jgi:phosphatidylinositol-3-phosphatase
MKKRLLIILLFLFLSACQGAHAVLMTPTPALIITTPTRGQIIFTPSPTPPTPAKTPLASAAPSTTTQINLTGKIPKFEHIVLIILENELNATSAAVIKNPGMPNLNALAKKNVTLSNYFAVSHPDLPNYLAMMSGNTFDISSDCTKCFVDAPNLADFIETSGRTWKSYLEGLPAPCFIGNKKFYTQINNPLIYFNSVRLNPVRCKNSIVPLPQLDKDLADNNLPNFLFIMPDLCDSGRVCGLELSDNWLGKVTDKLFSSRALGDNYLIIIVYAEGEKGDLASCCGMGLAGGQVAAVLISPLAISGFTDNTAYNHYSILKTILTAWNLPALGKTQDTAILPVLAPWGLSDGP